MSTSLFYFHGKPVSAEEFIKKLFNTITLPDATGTVLTTGNSDAGATTTSSSDVDHVLVDDGGVLKKITVANLGTATTDDATALAIALG